MTEFSNKGRNLTAEKRPHSDDFAEHLADSLQYSLLQAPINGAVQLIDHVANTKILPQVQFRAAPKPADLGSSAWAGDVVGSTFGTGLQMAALHRLVGAGAAAEVETSVKYGLRTAMPAITKSFVTGAIMGGVFTQTPEGDDFLTSRLSHAGVTGLTFAGMTAGSVWLKRSGNRFLANDAVSGALTGGATGLINADLHSLITHRELASWSDRVKSGITYAVGGGLAGGANILHEQIAPTSGIRGVRTAADMKRLADTTISPDAPEPYAVNVKAVRPKTEDLIAGGKTAHWSDKAAIELRNAVEGTNLPLDQKKLIVSSSQELMVGLDAINNRPDPHRLMVIYGSARFKPGDFRYERSRYLGGRAAQEGFEVMNGGAPTGSMGGSAQGAYEANGKVIGVTIKLPHENSDQAGAHHHLTIPCRNFFTRMEMLKAVTGRNGVRDGVFVIDEGGLGTAAEAFDTMTHIQTGKLQEVPIYLLGSKTWNHADRMLRAMEKSGMASPSDIRRYKIVDNPDEIFADLAKIERARVAEASRHGANRNDGAKAAVVDPSKPTTGPVLDGDAKRVKDQH